jgi:triosephosphate isomerase
MAERKKLVAGNWKMNGGRASIAEVEAMMAAAPGLDGGVELAVCPPAVIAPVVGWKLTGSAIALGGQDCHAEAKGAFTGDIAAEMWAEAGAKYVIVGHSERRAAYAETDQTVSAKAGAALRAGLTPIICLGESLAERDAGTTLDVVGRQLKGSLPADAKSKDVVIAYEPIWAIGTGRTPTKAQVAEVHAALRSGLAGLLGQEAAGKVRILYGGSVKPENAAELMHTDNVDGALVGGASLKAVDFLAIARACL